jgi:AcrR family transcriptional regulator
LLTVESARAYDEVARRQRAERILDAAAQLLQRWGYKRLTMDDVAAQAGIGKGTIYLHWKTREALFEAVLDREIVALLKDLAKGVQRDPYAALPHRLARRYYLLIMQRPLLRAFFTLDLEVLGKLSRKHQHREAQINALRYTFIHMLQEQGIVGADIAPNDLAYAFRTIIFGFLLTEPLFPDDQPDLEGKAELLALIVKGAFGINERPPEDAMRRVAELVNQLVESTLGEDSFSTAGMLSVPTGPPEQPPRKVARRQRNSLSPRARP